MKGTERAKLLAPCVNQAKRLMPGASACDTMLVAVELAKLDEVRAMRAEMREAGQTASKVLEVLLKQYSRLALATHAPEVGGGT